MTSTHVPSARTDLWAALAAMGAALYLFLTVSNASTVAEDAAILMRYSQHLGEGLGYVWNPGEGPVDGATDWLGATLLGAVYAVGVPLEAGPRLLGAAAHALTVALVVIVAIRGFRAPAPVALACAAFVAVGAARVYVEAGFLTTLFALGTLAGWACLVFAAMRKEAWWPWLFAVAMVFASLTRPEGLGVTGIMVVAAAFVVERRSLLRIGGATILVFGVLFTAFVFWRWQYFGRLLPLPFLKKGGGTLHWDGLLVSVRGVIILLGFMLPLLAAGLRPARPLRWLMAISVVIVGYTGMWILLSSEMDYYYRFQYALVPIVAASWPAVWSDVWPDLTRSATTWPLALRRALAVVAISVVIGGLVWQHRRFVPVSTHHSLKDVALLLRKFGGPENVVVTTEAGLVPLYSRWKAIDSWGLNDVRIVQEGGLTVAYLETTQPDVILFHSYFTPVFRPPLADNGWNQMVDTLHRYAVCRGYELAAVYAVGFREAHYIYVKPAWKGAGDFARALKGLSYRWWGSDQTLPELSALERFAPSCEGSVGAKGGS
ncbi:MAG TPA: hypothetical protein VJM31_12985 [Vicinamibacterales bacterium]|nr:hypothetical protein [Vicinamibacterales bacterium]